MLRAECEGCCTFLLCAVLGVGIVCIPFQKGVFVLSPDGGRSGVLYCAPELVVGKLVHMGAGDFVTGLCDTAACRRHISGHLVFLSSNGLYHCRRQLSMPACALEHSVPGCSESLRPLQ